MHPFGVALDSEPARVEPDRVDVNPPLIACSDLNSHWKQVRLDLVAEPGERGHANGVVVCIDSQIQVAMKSSLGSNEDVYTPPASHPIADRGPVQCVENLERLIPQHLATLDPRRSKDPSGGVSSCEARGVEKKVICERRQLLCRATVVQDQLDGLFGGADDVVAGKRCHLATGPSTSPCSQLGSGGGEADGGHRCAVEMIGIQLDLCRAVGGAVEQQQLVATSAKDAPQGPGGGRLKFVVGRSARASLKAELA